MSVAADAIGLVEKLTITVLLTTLNEVMSALS
jgi:hypothetical protein